MKKHESVYTPQKFRIGSLEVGENCPPLLIAGPCVLEDVDTALQIGRMAMSAAKENGFSYMFKASFDKANRTSITSYRGPGLKKGMEMLREIKARLDVPVISDIHLPEQAEAVKGVLDCIQIPAFLCRQTDLLCAAANTGLPVNVKKGQFMAPWDMKHVVAKLRECGGAKILLTERGTFFGYNNLVVDMRSLAIMRSFGVPVIFDATHSVQLPGGGDGCSSGQREFVSVLARAACAVGVNGLFLEVHTDPHKALCDGPNSLYVEQLPELLGTLKAVMNAVAHVSD